MKAACAKNGEVLVNSVPVNLTLRCESGQLGDGAAPAPQHLKRVWAPEILILRVVRLDEQGRVAEKAKEIAYSQRMQFFQEMQDQRRVLGCGPKLVDWIKQQPIIKDAGSFERTSGSPSPTSSPRA